MHSGKINTKKMTQVSFGEISTTGVKIESRRTFDFSPPWFNSDLPSYQLCELRQIISLLSSLCLSFFISKMMKIATPTS